MTRLMKKVSKKAGLEPGTPVFVGTKKMDRVQISVINYDETELREVAVETAEDCFPYKEAPGVTWIDIIGVHDVENIKRFGDHFQIHPLILEDIVNTGQRPRMDTSGDYIFLVLKMIYYTEGEDYYTAEQVSIIIGKNLVISFQEKEGDVFNPVRERLRKAIPRSRFMGTDYLAYTLVDAVVDNYFMVLERLGEQIEEIEDVLITNPKPENLETLHDMKRELLLMRKRIWPLREVVGGLERLDSNLIHDYSRMYIRDLYEHVIQVIDTVETFRDMASGLLDIYLSSVSNKMNEVMKVLTIIATVFIPLGFLAGVYGMNFSTEAGPFNMPELGLPFGYIGFWALALMVGGGLFLFFKKKRWL